MIKFNSKISCIDLIYNAIAMFDSRLVDRFRNELSQRKRINGRTRRQCGNMQIEISTGLLSVFA